MTSQEIRAELSVKAIEFEKAMDLGLPHSHLIEIYKTIKELQYQLALASVEEQSSGINQTPGSDLIIE